MVDLYYALYGNKGSSLRSVKLQKQLYIPASESKTKRNIDDVCIKFCKANSEISHLEPLNKKNKSNLNESVSLEKECTLNAEVNDDKYKLDKDKTKRKKKDKKKHKHRHKHKHNKEKNERRDKKILNVNAKKSEDELMQGLL